MKIILNQSIFQFQDKYYIQICGTAMGAIIAPTYATLTIGFLESQIYTIYDNQTLNNYVKLNFFRYLDDCFIILDDNLIDINLLFDTLNSLHPKIDFTMEKNNQSINFLDINISKDDKNKIATDIYYKKTNNFSYIPFTSNHPRHIKINIPYNLAYRIKRIVNTPELRFQRYIQLFNNLHQLKYPSLLIFDAIIKAENRSINIQPPIPPIKNPHKLLFHM
jgi:hypothetical protein